MSIRQLTLATSLILVLWSLASAQDSAISNGNQLVAQGRYEAAIKEYERVTTGDRESYAQAIYNIGVCYYELWQTDRAIEFFQRAIEINRGNYPKASFSLGVALEDQHKVVEAKAAYRQALTASRGGLAAASFKLGLLSALDNDISTAERLFRDATKRSGPHVASSHNNLGVMLARMGRLTEAEKEFALALRGGRFVEAEYNLKLCRLLLAPASRIVALKDLKLASNERTD